RKRLGDVSASRDRCESVLSLEGRSGTGSKSSAWKEKSRHGGNREGSSHPTAPLRHQRAPFNYDGQAPRRFRNKFVSSTRSRSLLFHAFSCELLCGNITNPACKRY